MTRGWNRILTVLSIAMLLPAGGAMALPFAASPMLDGEDAFWDFSGSAEASIVMERGAYHPKNAIGVYSGDTFIQLFAGGDAAGASSTVNFDNLRLQLGSMPFGFYLDSPDGRFYSDTAANSDLADHLWAARESDGTVLLGFEDLFTGGDNDFDDMVIAIRQLTPENPVAPVPEPATLLLLGAGLVGLASCRRKKA